ncbi:MAG: hypothetical protein KDA25_09650, partial [Phycisphaerales bacterium]|nr:hypothetical protein [Phycisphaerales bacterium]
PPNYDSMIGKLIVHAPTRAEAIARMKGALREYRIGPIRTTIPLYIRLMNARQFAEAELDIHYIERMLQEEATDAVRASGR